MAFTLVSGIRCDTTDIRGLGIGVRLSGLAVYVCTHCIQIFVPESFVQLCLLSACTWLHHHWITSYYHWLPWQQILFFFFASFFHFLWKAVKFPIYAHTHTYATTGFPALVVHNVSSQVTDTCSSQGIPLHLIGCNVFRTVLAFRAKCIY